jgi:protoheme IX farnesyltransferase
MSLSLTHPPVTTVGDFLALLKPRVMSLVIFTGLAGIVAAPGSVHPLTAFTALLCIAVAAGASGCLNMAYDSDIDGLMSRTAKRPIPMGHIGRDEALIFGWILAIGAVATMGLFVNFLAGGLLAFTVFVYVVVYTLWLKRRTAQNIVIGGLSGALPPAIGWAAVTGDLSLAPVLLVAIIFMWTPPHFWASPTPACKSCFTPSRWYRWALPRPCWALQARCIWLRPPARVRGSCGPPSACTAKPTRPMNRRPVACSASRSSI